MARWRTIVRRSPVPSISRSVTRPCNSHRCRSTRRSNRRFRCSPAAGGWCCVRRSCRARPLSLDFLRENAITVADLPPVYLGELLAAWERGRADLSGLPLRLMIVGGDVLAPEVAGAWARSGIAGARLVNAYGPTEATITALTQNVRPNGGSVPIGRPLPGTEIYILDPDGNPVPDGIVGELHIGGPRLAIGYRGRPDLTKERFRTHDLPHKSVRLYATGDRASFVPNSGGVVAFHGRIDDQVKIRGHRIELGEVEAALAACGHGEAAVVVESGHGGDPVLTAFVAAPAEDFDEETLRARLAERLPAPMVPARIDRRDLLPKTPGGKVDRRALKGARKNSAVKRTAAAPRDDIERKLLGNLDGSARRSRARRKNRHR